MQGTKNKKQYDMPYADIILHEQEDVLNASLMHAYDDDEFDSLWQ